MSDMARTMLLPAAPEPRWNEKTTMLQARLRQMEIQKGAFRNVTEASLREELQTANSLASNASPVDESDDEEEETREERQLKIWNARNEMLKQLDRAKNDTLHALDFISLLLSKHSTTAQASISPLLQQNVPTGSIDGRVLKNRELPLESEVRSDAASRGWKTFAFIASSERLLDAGDRLEVEAQQESSFWEQVAQIKSQGWSLSRLPRDSRAIGVHFGFSQSAPRFRSKGFALLRQGEAGKLQLDRPAGVLRNIAVQVKVLRDGSVTGQSIVTQPNTGNQLAVLDEIDDARNALFEEELFYEAAREARSIAQQGASLSADAISLTIDEGLDLEIVSTHHTVDQVPSLNGTDQVLAESCASTLRLLLLEAHRQNYLHRTQAPGPISMQPKPNPEYALLRPLMSQLLHQSHFSSLSSSLNTLTETLRAIGLTLAYKEATFTTLNPTQSSSLLKTAESTLTLTLPTKRSLRISISSRAGPPIYGSTISFSPLEYPSSTLSPPSASTPSTALTTLCQILAPEVAQYISDHFTSTQSPTQITATISSLQSAQLNLHMSERPVALLACHVEPGKIGLKVRLREPVKNSRNLTIIWTKAKISTVPKNLLGEMETDGDNKLVDVLELLRLHIGSSTGRQSS